MLEKREAMPNTSGVKQDRVEQILICLAAIAERLASMKEERYIQSLFKAALLEPEDLRHKICQRPSKVFLAHKVKASDKMRMRFLDSYALFHS